MLLPLNLWALDFVESLAAKNDPLYHSIRTERQTLLKSLKGIEYNPLRIYRSFYLEGDRLERECREDINIYYKDNWEKDQVLNSIFATLQYRMIESSIKDIAYYSKKLSINSNDFGQIVNNVISKGCSKNISIMSHRRMSYLFYKYFDSENYDSQNKVSPLDAMLENPIISRDLVNKFSRELVHSQYLKYASNVFKMACTWGQRYEYPRLMEYFMQNKPIAAYVLRQLTNQVINPNSKSDSLVTKVDLQTTKVFCDGIICRKRSARDANILFPRSMGSRSLESDFRTLYCNEINNRKLADEPRLKQSVQNFVKSFDDQEINKTIGYFISQITGVPEFNLWTSNKSELSTIINSPLENFWDNWAIRNGKQMTKRALFEEPLVIRPIKDFLYDIRIDKPPKLNFSISAGEFDSIFEKNSKLKIFYTLKIPYKDFTYIYDAFNNAWPNDKKKIADIKKLVSAYVDSSLKNRKNILSRLIIKAKYKEIIVQELLSQILDSVELRYYEGKDWLEIPVNFYVGNMALVYLKNRRIMLSEYEKEDKRDQLFLSTERVDNLMDEKVR